MSAPNKPAADEHRRVAAVDAKAGSSETKVEGDGSKFRKELNEFARQTVGSDGKLKDSIETWSKVSSLLHWMLLKRAPLQYFEEALAFEAPTGCPGAWKHIFNFIYDEEISSYSCIFTFAIEVSRPNCMYIESLLRKVRSSLAFSDWTFVSPFSMYALQLGSLKPEVLDAILRVLPPVQPVLFARESEGPKRCWTNCQLREMAFGGSDETLIERATVVVKAWQRGRFEKLPEKFPATRFRLLATSIRFHRATGTSDITSWMHLVDLLNDEQLKVAFRERDDRGQTLLHVLLSEATPTDLTSEFLTQRYVQNFSIESLAIKCPVTNMYPFQMASVQNLALDAIFRMIRMSPSSGIGDDRLLSHHRRDNPVLNDKEFRRLYEMEMGYELTCLKRKREIDRQRELCKRIKS